MHKNKHILGVDVSKDTLAVFNTVDRSFVEIPNTEEALQDLVRTQRLDPGGHSVGLESTGDYSFLPLRYFVERGFQTTLLNPLVTRRYVRGTIRNKKTDRSDAELIAEMVDHGEGRVVSEKDLTVRQKTLLRTEQKLVSIQSDLKLVKRALSMKETNGVELSSALREIDQLIEEIGGAAKKVFDSATSDTPSEQEQIIASHPGCGLKISAIISAESGDISRFPTARQFKAYAGIDPKVYQSGAKNVHGRMTKRGNPILRHALFLAAFVASRFDPQLKKYYQDKRAEGKSHTHAVCAVSRKLAERIYATVTQGRRYEVRSPEEVKVVHS